MYRKYINLKNFKQEFLFIFFKKILQLNFIYKHINLKINFIKIIFYFIYSTKSKISFQTLLSYLFLYVKMLVNFIYKQNIFLIKLIQKSKKILFLFDISLTSFKLFLFTHNLLSSVCVKSTSPSTAI